MFRGKKLDKMWVEQYLKEQEQLLGECMSVEQKTVIMQAMRSFAWKFVDGKEKE